MTGIVGRVVGEHASEYSFILNLVTCEVFAEETGKQRLKKTIHVEQESGGGDIDVFSVKAAPWVFSSNLIKVSAGR